MNKQIENLIREQNYEKALCEIEQYEFRNKKDVDINTYKFLCYCGLEEFSKCLDHAIASVKSQPYDAEYIIIVDMHLKLMDFYMNRTNNIWLHRKLY